MAKKVAELMVDVLLEAGVKRVYGVSGDSLNGFTDAIRSQEQLQWIHLRHEEVAAFAAGAEAHLTGQLSVCAGSCGPGNLHLINGLYDCHRSRVPVLAIAAQIPSGEIGSGYFQETHPEHLFAQCSDYCEVVSHPEQMPRVLEIAIQTAISRRGGDCRLATASLSAATTHSASFGRRDRHSGRPSQWIEENHDSGWGWLRGGSCGIDHPGREIKLSDCSFDAREGIHRVRHPLRRRDDGPVGILVRLLRDDELRPTINDRDRFPLSTVFPKRHQDRSDRYPWRATRAAYQGRLWIRRGHKGDA